MVATKLNAGHARGSARRFDVSLNWKDTAFGLVPKPMAARIKTIVELQLERVESREDINDFLKWVRR